jgi:drug/metabolite transporter (DMT)-like permease
MADSRMKNLGRLSLFSAALLWGVSFVVMKNVLESIPVLYVLAIRFCCAAIILLPACAGKLKKLDRTYLTGGALMGAALIIAYVFQTYGLRLTTPGKNAFLTSTYCVIVPFLYWAHIKKRPDRFNATAAVICIIGIGLISLDSELSIGAGDALTIICGFFFAVHIVITARFVNKRDPVMLAMLQFATAGLFSLVGAIILEAPPSGVAASDVWGMAYLTVICTAACLLMQVFGQKYTPPSQAAVIMTFESVFGAISSVALYLEVLAPRLIAGFALTFAAVVISETKLTFLRKGGVNNTL